MNVISLKGVIPKVFDGHVPMNPISDVWGHDLSFERGRSYIVKAASGRGKSSLCSYIYGLRKDYLGEITFDGRRIENIPNFEWDEIRQRSLGILFQDLKLFEELDAVENVLIKSSLTSYKSRSEIIALLSQLGLGNQLSRPVGLMSFGQQQRVAFVRMLSQPADFWLLDEPVSHLDDENALIMSQILSSEAKRNNTAVIVTTIGRDLPYNYDKTLML